MSRRFRVLVAEDNPQVARRICEMLASSADLAVIGPSHDGTTALAMFEAHQPDAIVVDLNMPGLNGIEVTRAVRAKSRCPILMMTNHDESSLRDAALAAGVDQVVHKTRELERLVERVAELARAFDPHGA